MLQKFLPFEYKLEGRFPILPVITELSAICSQVSRRLYRHTICEDRLYVYIDNGRLVRPFARRLVDAAKCVSLRICEEVFVAA